MTSTLTQLIHEAQQGDRQAADALFSSTYADLTRLARWRLRACSRSTLLDTGALVHESFLRFAQGEHRSLESRAHFMSWAAQVMRSVIVDHVRRRLAERRGGGAARLTLDEHIGSVGANDDEILDVHEALEHMSSVDPRLTKVVEMRYFSGMTEPEIADALGVNERTVRRDWQKARLLLRDALVA